MRRYWILTLACTVAWAGRALAIDASQAASTPTCRPSAPIVRVPDLIEGSGVAVSGRTPDRLWALNDSGTPAVIALTREGALAGRVRIRGAELDDWEAIATGTCPEGSCLFVGDIGDNNANRPRISIYRVPEPAGIDAQVGAAEVIHLTYPDGPQNAETLLATPAGELFIVTKGDTGPVSVYRVPRHVVRGTPQRLERVGNPRPPARERDGLITDGAVSPDGRWVVLRTRSRLTFYEAGELLAGRWREVRSLSLTDLGEPQGEGIAIGADKTIYLVGEAGNGPSRAGTALRLACDW